MPRMLIVEDSTQLRELVAGYFRDTGAFDVDAAKDGTEGVDLVSKNTYDIAILDIMLPGLSGFDICKILRRKSSCPIVFLTALGTEDNILKGYALGADEYMVKPFSIKVLYAKCLALLARSAAEKEDEKILSCGEIRMYPSRMEVRVGEREVDLPPKEYFLLKVLMENRGHVLGRDRLLDLVWGADFDGSERVVDSHIKKLRKSLGDFGDAIKTVIGGGYKVMP
jgi:Response regulators consisting of a CheY-like receiver domain and a winged-helix DNA-binding domain